MKIIAKKEIINAPGTPTPNCHASTVLPLNNGEVLAAWFGGTKEKSDDVDIWLSRRKNEKWSEPVCISADKNIPHWNPVLFRLKDGRIALYFKIGKDIELKWKTLVVYSDDEGKTWTEPEELVKGDKTGGRGPVKNKAIYLSDGTILAPASHEPNPKWFAFADISEDDGKTWHRSEYIPTGEGDDHIPLIQPTFWEDKSGTVHALLRSAKGKIFASLSNDKGRTWSKAYDTGLLNPNSGIDCVKAPNGDIMLVSNPAGGNWGDRTPLTLTVSKDNGKTWELVLTLEEAEVGREEDVEYSYPAITEKDGKFYITYTYNRLSIAFWEVEIKD